MSITQDQESILDKIISTQQVSHREHFKPHAVLTELLQGLSERERQVLTRRFGFASSEPETLESIGNSFQVTRERIRQIQKLAVQKLVQGKRAQELLQPIRQVVVEALEGEGGAATGEKLGRLLQEAGDDANLNVINFYLSEVLTDVVAGLGGEETEFILGWRLRNASLESITSIINQAQDVISAKGSPIPEDELVRELSHAGLSSPLGGGLKEGQTVGLLELSVNVRRNPFGEWGLTHWQTVSPKRMNDKIYLVLKKYGKPVHFREITRLVNEQKFDHKMAYPPTVHNELIMDKKYVLVGRGIYALKEWGFNPGVVADILIEILKAKGPLDRSQIVEEVLKQRLVKKGTVHLALTNKQKFQRLPDGRYTLVTPDNQT